MNSTTTRTTAFAASAASTCALAAGALASFGVAGLAFGAVGPPLLLASAGSAGLAVIFAAVANRPGEAEAQVGRVSAAWKAASEAFRDPSQVEPQPEIRWLESSPRILAGRRTRVSRNLGVLRDRLRRANHVGRVHAARALHRAAQFVAPAEA